MIDNERLNSARASVLAEEGERLGIGTLSEKVMHKTLKLYFDENTEHHEVELLGKIADIRNENGVIEIQTGQMSKLLPKLRAFLPEERVLLVHPIVAEKSVRYYERDTGEISQPRKSPRKKTVHDSALELYKLRELLLDKGLTVRLMLLYCEEFRLRDKRGRTEKLESIPMKILGEVDLYERSDYLVFLPNELGEEFTAKEYLKAIKSRSRYDYYALRLLVELGLLSREKKGRAFLYRRTRV